MKRRMKDEEEGGLKERKCQLFTACKEETLFQREREREREREGERDCWTWIRKGVMSERLMM